ncbi:hypothetical protein HER10_EVM0002229 [Colletotrichum scovillei]|uniref:uncharacterized protein n=1 Tax=Colletotrichum scovillei TaxID=1209932 RepID=UPI0015C3ABB8|nr:uncharacterized protein HER10_EVM0002229 [Colletotrichum scovillei]KAF4774665.1 hypothetical protein HER10_EVM0002229 [Colletotrichum scovillei]
MKFLLSLVVLAAAATAASPALLTKRAVYPQEGQVCCRHDRAENCICVARDKGECNRGICIM